ncbi:molecular chaperone [Kluyvera sp. STS39-E]|uniref:molecular chaperone n=1 Tax=Kluyvera sp. STS39-E TaxID=3234748 RepID=UPI0034C5E725
MYKFWCVFSSFYLTAFSSQAAVNINMTRVIFNHGETQRTVMLVNDGDYPVVIQSWIDDGLPERVPSQASAPFVVLPPVLKIQPGEQRELRVMTTGSGLANDRESLFWLNVYQIPPEQKQARNGEKVLLALRNQIKVLWRPRKIGALTKESLNLLRFSYADGGIYAMNDGPWNITLDNVSIGEYSTSGIVVSPYSRQMIFRSVTPERRNNKINFTVINDEGNRWGTSGVVD